MTAIPLPAEAGVPARDTLPAVGAASISLLVGAVGDTLREGDVGVLSDRLADFFKRLTRRYPATRLVLLTTLQTESERLAAAVALNCGVLLYAIEVSEKATDSSDSSTRSASLPFLYQASSNEAHFSDRERLLSRAARIAILRPRRAGEAPEPGNPAADRYESLPAAFVARHCPVLLALWDGKPSREPGDAGQTVQFRLNGLPEALEVTASRLDEEGTGPVEHLVTPRGDGSPAPDRAFDWRQLVPQAWGRPGATPLDVETTFRRQDEFNSDAARLIPRLAPDMKRSREYILPEAVEADASPALRRIVDRYCLADVLAGHFQRRSLWILRAVLVLGMVAVLSLQLAGSLPWSTGTTTLIYLSALLSAVALYLWARRGRFESRYLDYRALAEGLRVELFWRIAGLRTSVADLYLRRQRGELDWIRASLSAWDLLDGVAERHHNPFPDHTLAERVALVEKHWVADQKNYYLRRAARQGKINRAYSACKRVFFSVSVAQAFLKVLLPSAHPLMGTFGLTLALAGLLHLYVKTRAFAEHARQYERLGILFERADRVLNRAIEAEHVKAAAAVIAEAGREALQENADWLLLHRERPVSVPGL